LGQKHSTKQKWNHFTTSFKHLKQHRWFAPVIFSFLACLHYSLLSQSLQLETRAKHRDDKDALQATYVHKEVQTQPYPFVWPLSWPNSPLAFC
jgi:hypothetical protein